MGDVRLALRCSQLARELACTLLEAGLAYFAARPGLSLCDLGCLSHATEKSTGDTLIASWPDHCVGSWHVYLQRNE